MDSEYIMLPPGPARDRRLDAILGNIRKASQTGVKVITYHWTVHPRAHSFGERGGGGGLNPQGTTPPTPRRRLTLRTPVADSLEKAFKNIDNMSCQGYHLLVLDIQVIDDPAAATAALEPTRSRLLSELAAPASAATLAIRVGLARQKVNYHLRALEAHGLVRLAQERMWGGLTERLLVATAASYVVSPGALGPVAADPNREIDRLSASYLIALGARVVREVGDLVRRAKETGKRLATLAVDTEVRFRSAADRAAFSNELTEAITKLVSKYHDESAPGGRAHRLVVVAHPLPSVASRASRASEPRERNGADGVPVSERVGGSAGAEPPGFSKERS
jgi:DNA-binding transcriptional ArsR family regulator